MGGAPQGMGVQIHPLSTDTKNNRNVVLCIGQGDLNPKGGRGKALAFPRGGDRI